MSQCPYAEMGNRVSWDNALLNAVIVKKLRTFPEMQQAGPEAKFYVPITFTLPFPCCIIFFK